MEKTILKHLGFLVEEYGMSFKTQSFDEYIGFCGPFNAYSFYNENGCFTVFHAVQRGEWGWYTSSAISSNLYDLLENEIIQRDYISPCGFSYKKMLKQLADVIRKQILTSKSFFEIEIN